MSDFQFDLSRMTTREIAPYLTDMTRAHISWLQDIMPLVCTACPWGEATDPATYDLPIFSEQMKQLWEAFQQAIKDAPEAITFVSFNLSEIKAKDFDALVDEINGVKVEVIAGLLAKYITACPEVKGDIHTAESYLPLPYYTAFRPIANKLSKAGQEMFEDFLKQRAE